MRWVAITQRVLIDKDHGERRDALDQRWIPFLQACGLDPLPVPNQLPAACALLGRLPLAGIILSGGGDLVDLGGHTPERDAVEKRLLEYALDRNLPVLGVCRGMQFLQHKYGVILNQVEGHVACRHPIWVKGEPRQVNSFHTWGATTSREPWEVWATAEDGVVEAVRHTEKPIQGIMWHPERENPFRERDLELFREHFGGRSAVFEGETAGLQPGTVYWVTGLSGSGKTTVGELLTAELRAHGRVVAFLDGDVLREVFGNDLGHSHEERRISALRNARLCRLLSLQGVDVVCATISMFHEIREWNRNEIPRYREIYLRVPMEILTGRDPKGLYAQAGRGERSQLWGVDMEWEEPESPDLLFENDGHQTPREIVAAILGQEK